MKMLVTETMREIEKKKTKNGIVEINYFTIIVQKALRKGNYSCQRGRMKVNQKKGRTICFLFNGLLTNKHEHKKTTTRK